MSKPQLRTREINRSISSKRRDTKKVMIYTVKAETKSGLPYDRDFNTSIEAELHCKKLLKDGYTDFWIDERWSSLDEMYEYYDYDSEDSTTFVPC